MMIINYFRSTFRSLKQNKVHAFINVLGLSTGLACFAFIASWVKDELSFDKFNENYDRIVRLTGTIKSESGTSFSAVSSAPMAKALKDDYAEVENTVRFGKHYDVVGELNGKKILETHVLLTDPSFFNVFSFGLTKGDETTALNDPYSVILTASASKKYFGEADPMGQTINLFLYNQGEEGVPYKVTGVMPDAPGSSHLKFNILVSFKTAETANPDILTADGWGDGSFYTYLLLKEGVDPTIFSTKIRYFYGKYIGDLFKIWKPLYSYQLQPLADIHLRSNLEYEIGVTGNRSQVIVFSTIGIFILLLAAINYMNLSIARSIRRAKEVSIKKVVGARKGQLVMQYLFEAVVTSLLALVIGLIICSVTQPLFSQLTGKESLLFKDYRLILFLTGIAFTLGILSGIYPALILSGFKPAFILKGSYQTSIRGVLLRKSLVVAQFAITFILVTGIIIINAQMSYIRHKDLGYDHETLVFLKVHNNSDVISNYEAFRNELITFPSIKGSTTSNSLPVAGMGTGGSETIDQSGRSIQVNTARLRADAAFLDVYGIGLLAGGGLPKEASDSIMPVVLNEAAIKNFGWNDPATAIGKPFRIGGQQGVVKGVVRNFHFSSLQEIIRPLAMYPLENNFSRITVRIDQANAGKAIAAMERTWKKYFPSAMLDYVFLDKELGEQYRNEKRFSTIFFYFSVLSLLIACLGLYGLISFAAVQRTKEIGIRKVLGASVAGITSLLSKEFLKLVIWAFLIATPFAWYTMNNWLQDFAYRTVLSPWMFAMAGIAVVVIAFITISFQAIKAAVVNPVKSLRTE